MFAATGAFNNSASSGTSIAAGQQPGDAQQPGPGPAKAGDGKAPEKTISCVSCRKRKLKCDRIKPRCGTCARLRHDCEYPERRRNLGSKRRNMKELEARLAQVETQLVGEKMATATAMHPSTTDVGMEPDWDALGMDMNLDEQEFMDPAFDMPQFAMPAENSSILTGDFYSQELLALGLEEPLPPQDMMDELFTIYFERFHPTMPIMHKLRFYASLDRSPNMRPPICLRYAMWTMAASLSEKFSDIEDLLYKRSRKYIEAAEMKGHGEGFMTIYHAQTWGLIASYEAKKTYFSRSWMSSGRMTRLCAMLSLDRVDVSSPGIKTILPPAKDTIELEERRRTFWCAYYGDRWSSSGTGWPMLIDEKEIKTNLPCSEYAFENGIEETSVSLSEALTQDGASRISPFSGVIMSATLFGHQFQHLHRSKTHENPDDLQNGEFWKRHRKMDNVLSNTFMFLPDHLRLPGAIHDMNVIFLHLNIHTSAICLHQLAVTTAVKYKLDQNFIRQTQTRCLMAADEITNVMKLACHVDPAKMHSWAGFCLYVAAGVYVKNQSSDQPYGPSLQNLEFLLSAMRSIGRKHSITRHFIAQLELDIDAAGFTKYPRQEAGFPKIPNVPINGLLSARQGQTMTLEDLQSFRNTSVSSGSENGPARVSVATPASDIMINESRITSASDSPDPAPSTGPPRDSNPLLIPDNYFPGARTAPEWKGVDERMTQIGFPPFASDFEVFIEGRNNVFSATNSFVEGLNTMNPPQARRSPEGANRIRNKSPSNDNHTMRFPYRTATPVQQQTHTMVGGLCPWANAQLDQTNANMSSSSIEPASTEWSTQILDSDENANLSWDTEAGRLRFIQRELHESYSVGVLSLDHEVFRNQ